MESSWGCVTSRVCVKGRVVSGECGVYISVYDGSLRALGGEVPSN